MDPKNLPKVRVGGQEITLSNPELSNLGRHIRYAANTRIPLVEKGSEAGNNFVCVALGHSLQDPQVRRSLKKYKQLGYKFSAIKESISYLIKDLDITPDYSVNMDPQDCEIDRTPIYPGVTYCVATSCHPKFLDYVRSKTDNVRLFHSACGYMRCEVKAGIVYDPGTDDYLGKQLCIVNTKADWQDTEGLNFCPVYVMKQPEHVLYNELWGSSDIMVGGFTVANRQLSLIEYLTTDDDNKVLAGYDFGWKGPHPDPKTNMYPSFCGAKVIGKGVSIIFTKGYWGEPGFVSRADMISSAKAIAELVNENEHIDIIGDGMANRMTLMSPEEMKEVVTIDEPKSGPV